MNGTPLTYELLRSRGFRLVSTQASHTPHMALVYNSRYDLAIEITEPINGIGSRDHGWPVWLRSDLAHSRSRFVFMRDVRNIEEVERLWLALTDQTLIEQPYDREQFAESLQRERFEAERRYLEYAKHGLRYGHLPG